MCVHSCKPLSLFLTKRCARRRYGGERPPGGTGGRGTARGGGRLRLRCLAGASGFGDYSLGPASKGRWNSSKRFRPLTSKPMPKKGALTVLCVPCSLDSCLRSAGAHTSSCTRPFKRCRGLLTRTSGRNVTKVKCKLQNKNQLHSKVFPRVFQMDGTRTLSCKSQKNASDTC